MNARLLACIALFCALAAQAAEAAPSISVFPLGPTPSNNRLWNFQVTPDPVPTPLAVELAFAIDGTDLVDVDVNSGIWDTANPGLNPFTGTVTNGLWIDLIADRTFGAFGSINLTNPGPVDLFLIETAGLGPTTIRYGVAASGHPSKGARISQLVNGIGVNFDGYTGTLSVPEPATRGFVLAVTLALATAVSRRRQAA